MDEAALRTARTIVAGVFGCPVGDVPADAAIGSLPQWDSIAHISIIMAVEEKLGRRMTASEIASFEAVGSLAALFSDTQKEPR